MESSSADSAAAQSEHLTSLTLKGSHMKVKWFREDLAVARSNVIRNDPLTQFKNTAFILGVSRRFFLPKRKAVLEKFYILLTVQHPDTSV
jgi:hypothetical protein